MPELTSESHQNQILWTSSYKNLIRSAMLFLKKETVVFRQPDLHFVFHSLRKNSLRVLGGCPYPLAAVPSWEAG